MVRTTAGSTDIKGQVEAASQASAASRPPVRVMIVGGGCAGLAAAWELSRCPGYEVEVFESSFRLGGKGASGRDGYGRIHEHGLHVWLGCYENAFRLMRECYAEVAAHGWGPLGTTGATRLAHGSIDEAFLPEPHIGVGGIDAKGEFNVWRGVLPPAKGAPGDPLDVHSNPFSLTNYLLRCLELVKTLVQSLVAPPSQGWSRAAQRNEPADTEELVALISSWMCGGVLSGMAGMLNVVTLIEQWVRRVDRSKKRSGQVLKVLVAMSAQMRKGLVEIVGIDDKLRWKTEMVDIVLAIAVGLVRDRLLFRRQGFDAINHIDYRAWLARHGATRAALDSRFIAGIYELVFAFEDGEHDRPAFAAGVALRSALRMFFTYRGAMFWRMRSGMGDTVFAPLYRSMLEPLPGSVARSKVAFHFLHTLEHIELGHTDDGRVNVDSLHFSTRGDGRRTSSEEPCALDHSGCWPLDARLLGGSDGTPGTRSLRCGEDFDAVILAMGVDDFIKLLRDGYRQGRGLFEQLPEHWSQMAHDARTVATQAAQVWLDADFKSLGWKAAPGIVTALDLPFQTWADMTHTLASERAWRKWTADPLPSNSEAVDKARSVAYFCSPLPDRLIVRGSDAAAAGSTKEVVADSLQRLLQHDARRIWPNAFGDQLTAVDRLAHPEAAFDGTVVLDYVQANTEGSQRYTLSLPGSIASRISPLDATFANATIAGDWTACGLDAGCVEAAVMSGKLAAHAITGHTPSLASIIGYDHP